VSQFEGRLQLKGLRQELANARLHQLEQGSRLGVAAEGYDWQARYGLLDGGSELDRLAQPIGAEEHGLRGVGAQHPSQLLRRRKLLQGTEHGELPAVL